MGLDLTEVSVPDKTAGFSIPPPSRRTPVGHLYLDFSQQLSVPRQFSSAGLMRPYSTGSLKIVGAVTINPDEWPRRCPEPPQLQLPKLQSRGSPRIALSPEEKAKQDQIERLTQKKERATRWDVLREARRANEGFSMATGRDRNPRTFSAPYYSYHVNQRPVPWYLRGHRFRLTGTERTGDIEDEERFEKRAI
jgi:hypothetical protein